MAKMGENYEIFVQSIFRAILESETDGKQENITVELKKKIKDNAGIPREFDVYWEYKLGGFLYKTVIECKDYSNPVSVEKIDALIGKLHDLPDIKGIFATKKGYQSGAKTKAEQNKIDLLIVREVDDCDFVSVDGTPLLRKIHFNMHINMPSQVLNFSPLLDAKWMLENWGLDPKTIPLNQLGVNYKTFIEDLDKGTEYSLLELQKTFIKPVDTESNGVFEKTVEFKNAFIKYEDGTKHKLAGYTVKYMTFDPVKSEFEIDYAKELLGVVEYLSHKRRKVIGKHGHILTDELPDKSIIKKLK